MIDLNKNNSNYINKNKFAIITYINKFAIISYINKFTNIFYNFISSELNLPLFLKSKLKLDNLNVLIYNLILSLSEHKNTQFLGDIFLDLDDILHPLDDPVYNRPPFLQNIIALITIVW